MKRVWKFFFFLIFIVASIYFLFFHFAQSDQATSPIHSKTELKEVDRLAHFLNEKGGFFDQVGKELAKSGYAYQTTGAIYSKENIQVAVIVPDDEEITEKMLEDIFGIYQQMIVKANMNPNAFNIQIGHADEIEW